MSTTNNKQTQRRFLVFAFVAIAIALAAAVFWARHRAEQIALELVALRLEINASDTPLEREGALAANGPGVPREAPWYDKVSYDPSGTWFNSGRLELEIVRSELLDLGLQDELLELDACLSEEGVGELFRAAFSQDGQFGDPQSWSSCQRDFVALLGRLDPTGRESALQISRLEPGPGKNWRPSGLRVSQADPFPQLPVMDVLLALQRLVVEARVANAAGEAQAATRYLNSALDCAQLFADGEWLFAHVAWVSSVSSFLRGLNALLPQLPADVELQSIEAQLESMNTLDLARSALLGERSLIDSIFVHVSAQEFRTTRNSVRDQPGAFDQLSQASDLYGSTREHLAYLRTIEHCLATFDMSWPEARQAIRETRNKSSSRASDLVLSHWPDTREAGTVLDSERIKALAALRAHRAGVEVARAWLEQQVNPLTAEPFIVREDGDGTVSVLRDADQQASKTWQLAPARR